MTKASSGSSRRGARCAAAIYTAIALAATWPLLDHVGSAIAWDLGDPVFNCWVMMWTGGQVLATLSGNFNAIHEFWNGNIFFPQPLTIAYSEHLTPQMLQALPVYAATGNMVLAYNLLFLSTIVLAGLGTFLLVRELTGRPLAAFVAGLAFAYAPYRLAQYAHLQVMSTYWMPLALYAFRRYFVTLRTRPLVGASAALVAQNLSCGYFMLFFSPFAAVYCVYEMAHRRLLGNWRVWRSLVVVAVAVALLTWPFVSPYLKLRHTGDVGVRTYAETLDFSADTYSFATAPWASWFWGIHGLRMLAYPKGEGEGFPGLTIAVLAMLGLWSSVRLARSPRSEPWRPGSSDPGIPRWRRAAGMVAGVLLVIDAAALVWLFVAGALPFTSGGRPYHASDPLLTAAAALTAALAILSPASRRIFGRLGDSSVGFYAIALVAAALLALGPRIMSAGRPLGAGPYAWLLHLPGFDGVRVPARFLMLVTLFLAVLAGFGAAAVLRMRPRWRLPAAALLSAGILVEGTVGRLPMNVPLPAPGLVEAPRALHTGEDVSALYQYIKDAPGKVVLIEFPFGSTPYELLATFYAGYHRRPLVNGYSGFFPETYLRRATFLSGIPVDFDAAAKALRSSGATHALVHEAAFPNGRGHEVSDWLTGLGATLVASQDRDRLFVLRDQK